MAKERLRDALLAAGLTFDQVADKIGVDPKTVERWTTGSRGRVPYARHRRALAALLGESESYLWPEALPPERKATIAASEVVAVYPHRNLIPADLWGRLLQPVSQCIEVLVHAGLFLVERPDFIRTLSEKAKSGVAIRIAFGDPESDAVALRSNEEHLGDGVLAARIKYGLVPYTPLLSTEGVEFRYHASTLYNSIFRFDDEMIVNTHVYGVPGPHAPAMHIRKLGGGDLFDTYAKSFDDVWTLSKPAEW